jgi:hypothetical protein
VAYPMRRLHRVGLLILLLRHPACPELAEKGPCRNHPQQIFPKISFSDLCHTPALLRFLVSREEWTTLGSVEKRYESKKL